MFKTYLAVYRDARNSAAKIAAGEPRNYKKFTLFVFRYEVSMSIQRTSYAFKSYDAVDDYVRLDVPRLLQRDTGLSVAVKTITDDRDGCNYVVDASLDCDDYTRHETLPEDKVYARLVFVHAL